MALLQDIVASVLHDVLMAQHEANLMAEELAQTYASSPILRQMPVPAVSVGEMAITLRFAFADCRGMSHDKSDGLTPSPHDGQQPSPEIMRMEVIADADRLANLDSGQLQSITLKISAADIAAAKPTREADSH